MSTVHCKMLTFSKCQNSKVSKFWRKPWSLSLKIWYPKIREFITIKTLKTMAWKSTELIVYRALSVGTAFITSEMTPDTSLRKTWLPLWRVLRFMDVTIATWLSSRVVTMLLFWGGLRVVAAILFARSWFREISQRPKWSKKPVKSQRRT